jgi:type VI protein secretion system component VasK
VLEKNAAYVDALSALAASMREVARAGPTDVNVHQAAAQSYDKALDTARQVAREFKPVGVEGVDSVVQRLLEEPILHTRPYITRDIAVAEKGRINGELSKLCLAARATLGRFPFNSRSEQDAGLAEMAAIFAPAAGSVWKFQAAALSDLVTKDGGHWKVKDPAKKPQAAPEMVAFLNRAQELADAFYPGGAAQPQLTFTLLPKLDNAWKDWTLEMELNGSTQAFTSLRKQFSWPPPPAAREAGAVIRLRRSGVAVTAASGPGLWGIFRVMAESEPRALGSRTVEWKWMRVPGGRREPLTPPVQMEIVEFPGGADVFNPKFFEGMQCPARAVQ